MRTVASKPWPVWPVIPGHWIPGLPYSKTEREEERAKIKEKPGMRDGNRNFMADNRGAVDILIALAIGLTVLVTVGMIAAYIAASVYNVMEPELTNLQNKSPTIYSYVESVITGSFKGMQIFGNFTPVVVIVMVAVIVIGFVMLLQRRGSGGGGVGEL